MKLSSYAKSFIEKYIVIAVLYVITIGIVTGSIILSPHVLPGYTFLHVIIIFFASVLLTKYLFYLTVSPWHDVWSKAMRRKWRSIRPQYTPLVSIIIPAWNEEVGIVQTMESLIQNTYGHMEIVVVNDGSTDDSDRIIRNYIADLSKSDLQGKKIIYAYQENSGKGAALNHGVALSHGEILISIDADCLVAADTVQNFVEYFRNPKIMAAVGNVKVGNTTKLIGLIQYMEFLFSFYFKKADSLMNTIYIIGGAAGAFRREVFTKLGGYKSGNITEDIELSLRIQDAGMRIVYADDAIVYTEGANEIAGLQKQRLRWKRGRFQTFREYMHMFFSTRKEHNQVLTFVMLPLALFSEMQLFLEGWFLAFLYVYAYVTHDFSAFLSGIIVVSSMFFVQMVFDDKETRKASFLILAPIAWLLFYFMTYIETMALLKSIWGSYRKTEVSWQQWKRTGLINP